MHRLVAAVAVTALAATGCLVGDPESEPEVGALGARGNPANSLRWRNFTSTCISGSGLATSGGSLSAFFDNPRFSTCTTSATLDVPAGVRLTRLYQAIRGDGVSTLRYSAAINGSRVTSRTVDMPTGLETTVSVLSIGASLCTQAGTATRHIPVSFTVTPQTGAVIDSVDWELTAESCDE